jgi:hypothetical protein
MTRLLKIKIATITIILIVVIVFAFGINYILFLRKAHSTFENYYAFRGCVQLMNKTDDYGLCKISSGETIKIVKFRGKWYLDGDLPCGFFCF